MEILFHFIVNIFFLMIMIMVGQMQVEGASSAASDLAVTAARERAALDDCRELLSLIAEMQVDTQI